NQDYPTTYAYTGNGRMARVWGPGLNTSGVSYGYWANSDLVKNVNFLTAGTAVSATYTYEAHRDLITTVENKRVASPAATISKYEYVNDAIGRRTAVTNTGEAFSATRFTQW